LSTLPLSKLSDDRRDQIRSSPVWLHQCSSVVELKVGILLRAHFKESLPPCSCPYEILLPLAT
jgi:hypothetical protein